MAKSKKKFVNTEIVDQEQEKMAHGKTWAVKIKEWKNGLLIKVLYKKLFKNQKEAEQYYNQQNLKEHVTIELSIYLDGNERTLKTKGDK